MPRFVSHRMFRPLGPSYRVSAVLAVALFPLIAVAGNGYRDVEFGPSLTLDGKKLVLNGVGVRQASVFKVDVYAAALYLPERTSDGDALVAKPAPAVIQMAFFREVAATDTNKVWDFAFEKNCGTRCKEAAAGLELLKKTQPDVKAGDRMEYRFAGNKGSGPTTVSVLLGGNVVGKIDGAEFASVLLATWLGKEPPTERLKEGLLGKRESP